MRRSPFDPRIEGCAALLGALAYAGLVAVLAGRPIDLLPPTWRIVGIALLGAGGLMLARQGLRLLADAREAEARRFAAAVGPAIAARERTPAALRALGLRLPCSLADIHRAYRRLALRHHPDAGGDNERFLRLRRDYREALEWMERHGGPAEKPGEDQRAGA